MAVAPENLNSSLTVPSVKEMAIQKPKTVPSRYVRDEFTNVQTADQSLRVALIDMRKLLSTDSHVHLSELQKLHSACKHWGLFQIINHGIPEEIVENMRKRSQEFFDLPAAEKERIAQKPGCLQGYGHAFVTSEQQKLEWNDMLFLKVLPEHNKMLEFWPENPPKFRETLESYSEEVRKVAVSLIKFMGQGLGLDLLETQELCDAYGEGFFEVRMNCYPACPQPERVLGCNPHQDISGITLLLDCGDMPGLQVLKDGHWISVEPIPGALVVNIGNLTQVMSNGTYTAPDHRAVVNNSKERLSVATFCYPNSRVNIGPAKSLLVKSGSAAIFKTVSLDQYFHAFFNRKLEASFIDSLKL